MSDTRISALTAAASALDPDEIPINEAGVSKKLTVAQIRTFIAANVGTAYGRAILALTNAAGLAALIAATGDTAWTAPSLLHSWVNFGGAFATAGYRKDGFGVVRLKGLVKSGVSPIIFNLPAGYRPAAVQHFIVDSNDVFGTVTIGSDGNVTQDVGTGDFCSLTISFLAEA